NPLPSATIIHLPLLSRNDLERYEGMLVHFADTLTVTDNNNLGKYGELTLSAKGNVYQPTQITDPNDSIATGTNASGTSNIAAIQAHITSNDLRSILLDDGRTISMTTLPYINTDNTLRVGSTIDSLWGIMGFAYDQYRLQPTAVAAVKIKHQPRPTVPDVGAAANIKVASFNVLNFFNGDGFGGGFPTTRGASSLVEFARQRDKIINAILAIDADIVGLIEIENDGVKSSSAIQNLVNGLNAYLGAGTYAIVQDGDSIQSFNTDEIRCGIIYKTAIVDTIGAAIIASDSIFNRPPLAQTFKVRSSDSVFTFIINHFKAKGCTSSKLLDKDQNDGQSCYNDTRK
ncbi:MAG: ExeM/NucH family extracellular endonuclease, partial [Chitinophagaceae bacterium]|nr:ExeM/NucH family extracellular endonuclease [Chitinophagaceae bacterium]